MVESKRPNQNKQPQNTEAKTFFPEFPVGSMVLILQHRGCIGSKGLVEKVNEQGVITSVRCLTCKSDKVIPDLNLTRNESGK